MVSRLTEADEQLHQPVPGHEWTEAYGFEFTSHDAALAGFVVMTAHPHHGRSWCWSGIAERGRPVCIVDEPEAPLPRRHGMELRAPALWVDVEIEVPFVHATVGMEAFGLAFDDPDEALRSGHGDRTPFGLDLEWESDDANAGLLGAGVAGYELTCRVTGEVLLGPERFEIDCPGRRWHRWGTRAWWDEPPVADDDLLTYAVTSVPFSPTVPVAVRAALGAHGWNITRRFALDTDGIAR